MTTLLAQVNPFLKAKIFSQLEASACNAVRSSECNSLFCRFLFLDF